MPLKICALCRNKREKFNVIMGKKNVNRVWKYFFLFVQKTKEIIILLVNNPKDKFRRASNASNLRRLHKRKMIFFLN